MIGEKGTELQERAREILNLMGAEDPKIKEQASQRLVTIFEGSS